MKNEHLQSKTSYEEEKNIGLLFWALTMNKITFEDIHTREKIRRFQGMDILPSSGGVIVSSFVSVTLPFGFLRHIKEKRSAPVLNCCNSY